MADRRSVPHWTAPSFTYDKPRRPANRFLGLPEAMPFLLSPACPLSRARPEANRPNRNRQSFRAARKVRRRVAESAAPLGSGRSARPPSVRVLMAFSRSRRDGDLPFFPVVQSGVLICQFWCVSVPYPQLDTNLMPKRGSTLHQCQSRAFSGAMLVSSRNPREISAGVPTGGQISRLGYSFRAILRQSSQRFSLNCWPRSGIAPQNLQTHPSVRHKSAHVLFLSRSAAASVLMGAKYSSARCNGHLVMRPMQGQCGLKMK
jgi:hypothetical protein